MDPVPVVCEYTIQNENDKPNVVDPYCNIFILPKKYYSVQDVRISDVISAFPMTKNSKRQYMFRFETTVYTNKRKVNVWLDVGQNLDVSVPNADGQIRMKVLRLPEGIGNKKPVQLQQMKTQNNT